MPQAQVRLTAAAMSVTVWDVVSFGVTGTPFLRMSLRC
jgi:hypothetical protein